MSISLESSEIMDASSKRAYTYLCYRVLLDVRSASYTHSIKWWKPKSWVQVKKDMAEINKIADVFHNLPDLLANRPNNFDEKVFWESLSKRLPNKFESYHREFNDMLEK